MAFYEPPLEPKSDYVIYEWSLSYFMYLVFIEAFILLDSRSHHLYQLESVYSMRVLLFITPPEKSSKHNKSNLLTINGLHLANPKPDLKYSGNRNHFQLDVSEKK